MSIKNVKGTHDIIGEEATSFTYIENLLKQIAELFGYQEVRTPVIEYSELFVRSVGESSDVVRKEMYTFLDKGERSITLRPEFTAGIIRLIVQNKLLATSELPLKTHYVGPAFRYERPQLGRYREFNQFGVEAVGINSAEIDAEVIVLSYTMLQSLNLENVLIKINTLGDEESRHNYKNALKQYFSPYLEKMCPDCHSRYELNPLRILDCKVPEDQEIVKGAPKIKDYLSKNAKEKFDYLLSLLDGLEIPYEIDDTLVRGLDYYSETVFEFHYTSRSGKDYGALGAGGHYDKLVKELGGPDVSGIGFSLGIERLYSVLKDDGLLEGYFDNDLDIYVMPIGQIDKQFVLQVTTGLRLAGYRTDQCFEDVKLTNMFKRAERKNAKYAIIIGENEIEKHEVIIKNLRTTEQETCPIDQLIETISRKMNEEDLDEEFSQNVKEG
ncbi:MAG TPA: histidine--tRNA ligase [Erysipelotrichaceae bacterium]|nr:histidine--tRNA ligase [Erysipelotrichaceae bacterium]